MAENIVHILQFNFQLDIMNSGIFSALSSTAAWNTYFDLQLPLYLPTVNV